MRRFESYGVIVTGGARGIGEATARRFAREGAAVLIADLDGAAAGRTAASITAEGAGRAEAVACDVSDRAAVDAAVAHAVAAFGRLDVLVNNAYACSPHHDAFAAENDEDWHRDLDVSLTGAMRCSRAALPHLAAAGGRGAIVNVGSVNGIGYFGNHSYSAAKAGLMSLTRTLSVQAGPSGVRVNLVAPGTVRTPAWAGREAVLDALAGGYPLGRIGEPADIAAAVTFLASTDASWITGATLPVDGGILNSHASFTDEALGQD